MINEKETRYCCRSPGGKKKKRQDRQNRRFLNKASLERKLSLHLDKVIGHQGSKGENCTRKGREKKRSQIGRFRV